jgi:1A family penicillin-binding protein
MNYYSLEPQPQETPEPRVSPLARGLLTGTVVFFACVLLAVALALVAYARVAADLPLPGQLRERVSTFQSTRIYDRNGNLLNETFDPDAGRRVEVPLDRISPYLIQATISTEDANFYRHPGVDPRALARAVYYAVLEREFVSGASTIPQQLVKMVFLTPERSAQRKIQEAILAAEVSRTYSKDEILTLYLNEIYYGNFAYGINAAATTYFGKNTADLTLAEAALLAGLPQLPSFYDPYQYPERAKNRQAVVLGLMVENGYITAEEANAAWQEPLNYVPMRYDFQSPHFVLYVRQQLEELFRQQEWEALRNRALNITTTLDPALQEAAERIVREQVDALADRRVSNGALVAMNPNTGEIYALVGSADFSNVEISGQVNMALAPRQPGSSIKPFVYLGAFEKRGWNPGTLLADIEEEFPDGANPPWVPRNYNLQEHGMVTVRSALANSYNIPAVRALQELTIPEFLQVARRVGITTFTRPDYGLSLSLGSGEVPLLELTGAFAVLANDGVRQPPLSILKIEDNLGNVICEMGTATPCRFGAIGDSGEQVVSPTDAHLLTAILSDNAARAPIFGTNSALNIGRPAAAKTGTTNDYRDSLTVGYTPQLVTGVWIGNTDNSPMERVAGLSGAAQIWNRFMNHALANTPAANFNVPSGVRPFEICEDTGTQPSGACPQRIQFSYAEDRPPLPPEQDLWQFVRIDRISGKLATEFTPVELIEERAFKIYPPEYRAWAEANGIPQPPTEESDVFISEPQISIDQPGLGSVVHGIVTVVGTANVPGFASYELDYGVSHDPGAFSAPIWGPVPAPVENGILGHWDTSGLGEGPHTLRLVVRDQFGNAYESRIQLFVEHPQPEPVPEEPTPTPVPVETEETPTPVPVEIAPEPEPVEPEQPPAEPTVEVPERPETEEGPEALPTVVPTTEE